MPADVFIDTRDSRSDPVDDAIGPRHPLLITAAAQAAQAATHGRFSLGLGLGGHPIETFIAPTIRSIAVASGRPEPRIIAMISVAVTDDVSTARPVPTRR